jgi:hypothetical protein
MNFKENAEITNTVLQSFALVVGAIWVLYVSFYQERVSYPRLEIELEVSDLSLTEQEKLVRVDLKLSNIGKTRLILNSNEEEKPYIYIQQVTPILKCVDDDSDVSRQIKEAMNTKERKGDNFSWCLLARRGITNHIEIEPDNVDHLDFEFAIPSKVKAIRVYSFFPNAKKGSVGWSKSELYVLSSGKK